MSFCTKCGRQLADGEVCTCQQTGQPQVNPVVQPINPQVAPQVNQAAQQMNQQGAAQMNVAPSNAAGTNPSFISELGVLFKGLIKKPVEAVSEYVDKSSIMTSAILIVVLSFLSGVASLFYMIERNVDAKISAAKYYNPLIPSTWVVDEPYEALEIIFRFVCEVFSNIIISVLFAALIYLLIKFLFEKDSKITIAKALSIPPGGAGEPGNHLAVGGNPVRPGGLPEPAGSPGRGDSSHAGAGARPGQEGQSH